MTSFELPKESLDQLFITARTAHAFKADPLPEGIFEQLISLTQWAPTAFNSCPARFVFITSEKAREKLIPALSAGNVAQVRSAPVTVIVAYDTKFFDNLPELFPAYDAKALYDKNPTLAEQVAFRNSSLQGAYLIMAARALGLDAGPMSGFNAEAVDSTFFADGRFKANFLLNLGYADHLATHPRGPRLTFSQVSQIL
ncbi:MAG: malonic semialdehyde reductase [Ferrovum sp. 37-45-19]|nr:MAG: malonic semialdehyde reductase [Ferrovum sp. 21-44-67]OYV94375.1 MAG: malonic semialdehyde reductase [Ferrovum sp. 37-45-19]OZB33247.1 MAG: malonic semialdehyde reductase [Ferrovum sp. 34-44-207]HQT80635.1 malonic semialdehyde reductase [Ferrovaceae bacterium]HQU06740.1 malonic semialdehyde reductase [Ferrovaceae bacterium]